MHGKGTITYSWGEKYVGGFKDGKYHGKGTSYKDGKSTSGRYENSVGEDSFAVLWTDPDFTPADKSFYYVRVLEIPTPRNGLLDSIALGLDKPPRGTSIIQERAYSSPIWYHPK